MKKLYEKSEIWFAVMWIIIYVVVCGNLRNLGDDSPYMMLGLIVISVLMFAFVKVNHLEEKYGLNHWSKDFKAMLLLIPLWIITTGNLWGGIEPHYKGAGLIFAVVSMALVGFAEELIFRGFLFKAMLKDGKPIVAIIVSSVTFGMGHIVNLLTGHFGLETFVQMFYAVATGFIMTYVFYIGKSLIPCIISHSLIDVFSKFNRGNEMAEWIYIGVIIVTSVFYCIYLSRLKKDDEISW